MEPSDALLVKKAQAGSLVAFETLVERYQHTLLRFVRKMLLDTHDAEDIVQETFITLYKQLPQVDPEQKFSSFLYEIAKNRALTFLRRQKKQTTLTTEIATDEESSWYENLTLQENKIKVREALAQVPRIQRRIIELYYFKNWDYKTISQKLALPLNTVRTHLRRGKKSMKGQLV